jgi:membrane fusion protein (multidrug efflux system)
MKKAIWWIVLVCLLFAVGFRIFQSRRRIGPVKRRDSEGIPVAVIKPKIGAIESIISFVGNIKGEEQTQVFSETSGKLMKYTVNEGDKVRKDQTIAFVDRSITAMEYKPARVKSSISGVVGKLLLDKGNSVNPQVPVAVVAKMDKMKVVFDVGEKKISKLRKGMDLEIVVDAYPEEVFKAKVTGMSSMVDPTSRTISCEAIIPNPQHKLKPGMFAEINLFIETRDSTLLLPRDALIQDLETNKFYLFVVEGREAVKREIEIGITTADVVEIKNGLSNQDMVIIKGQQYLTGGERVEIVR